MFRRRSRRWVRLRPSLHRRILRRTQPRTGGASVPDRSRGEGQIPRFIQMKALNGRTSPTGPLVSIGITGRVPDPHLLKCWPRTFSPTAAMDFRLVTCEERGRTRRQRRLLQSTCLRRKAGIIRSDGCANRRRRLPHLCRQRGRLIDPCGARIGI